MSSEVSSTTAPPAPTTTPSSTPSSSSGGAATAKSATGVQLKRTLSPQGYDAQAAALAPAQVQMKVGEAPAPQADGGAAKPEAAAAKEAPGRQSATSSRRSIQRQVQRSETPGAPETTRHLGAIAPVGDHSSLVCVQLDAGSPTPPAPAPQLTSPTTSPVMFKWVSKTVEGKAVHYLVEDPTGTVPLGPEQRSPIPENVPIENKVRAFELTLGQHASADPVAIITAQDMASRVVQIVNTFLNTLYDARTQAEVIDNEFGRILGGTNPIWAGTIGDDKAVLETAAAGGGLRETLSIAGQFISQFGEAYVKGAKTADLSTFMTKIANEKETLTERLAQLDATKNRIIPNDAPAVAAQISQQGAMRQGVPEGTSTATTRTVGQLAAEMRLEHPLSQAELNMMGIPTGAGVSKEDIAAKKLTWNEGIRAFMIKEHDDFVKKLRQAAVPVGAGTSGTTARIMAMGQMLGVTSPIFLRAACIGFLVPIRAHTLWEVLQGAVAGGAPAPAANLSAFKEIEPFGPSRNIYPDPEFWTIVDDTVRRIGGG